MTQLRGANVVQNPKEKPQILENQRFAIQKVPGAGIEPARISPLVFETSASTDSAIRAGVIASAHVMRNACDDRPSSSGAQRYCKLH